MKLYIILTAFLITSISLAQETTIEDTNTIENQFDKIYRKSTTYQVYKVISKDSYQQLK